MRVVGAGALVLLAMSACGDDSAGPGGSGGASGTSTTSPSSSATTHVSTSTGVTSTAASTSGATSTASTGNGGSGNGGGGSYSTDFPLDENPISEGGMWINGGTDGLDWHDVSTARGLAIGHQSGTSYTDGTALLTGSWGAEQTLEAVVHTVNPHDSCYQEVELRLRSSLSAHDCSGYEVSFKASKSADAYLIIVRWNGALGDFTYLQNLHGSQYGVADGDIVKATISGNLITAYINGVEMGSATDDTYASGNPGMGFNLETGDASCIGTNGDYGFTHFAVETH